MKSLYVIVLSVLAVVLSLTQCSSPVEQKSTLPQNKVTKKPLKAKDFFPLKTGNTWTYTRKTLNPGKICAFSERTIMGPSMHYDPGTTIFSTSHCLSYIAKTTKSQNGIFVSKETYTIMDNMVYKNEDYAFTDNKGEQVNGFYHVALSERGARDGRYWGSLSAKMREDPNVRWGKVNNTLHEIVKSRYADGAVTSNQIVAGLLKPEMYSSGHTWIVFSKGYNSIAVPAGMFSGCLVNRTVVGADNAEEVINGGEPHWVDKDGFGCFSTYSYFADGVGLVREFQVDSKGDTTYILELESFEIK